MVGDEYGEWLARGQAHQQAGRPIDAMLCYRRALKANRNAVQAQFHLGEVLRALEREDDAIDAWRAALTWQPKHVDSLCALAGAARRRGAYADAVEAYRRALTVEPQHTAARAGLGLALLAQGDDTAYAELRAALNGDRLRLASSGELACALEAAPASAAKRALLADITTPDDSEPSPLVLALALEDALAAGEPERARGLLARAEARAATIEDTEVLRRLALSAGAIEPATAPAWAARYASRCAEAFAPTVPLLWPRRTRGAALRVAYLIALDRNIVVGGVDIEAHAYLRVIVAGHARADTDIDATVYVAGSKPPNAETASILGEIPIVPLVVARDAVSVSTLARGLAERDYDALIDLAGMPASTGPLLAQRPARSIWTYKELAGAHAAPLVGHLLPQPLAAGEPELAGHRAAIEATLRSACAVQLEDGAAQSAGAMAHLWRAAVQAHQGGDAETAIAGYRDVLAAQPEHAPAHYLLGILLRDRGQGVEAERELEAALTVAPAYSDARAALANLQRDATQADEAAATCRNGLALDSGQPVLWRALGLAELARRDGEAARSAFEHALALAPTDAETHYNHGVALQMLHRRDDALRAYQRALAFAPDLLAAEFNIGVIFHEQGHADAAILAFEQVLERDPRHVQAHKALGETLLSERRIDDWFRAFRRFETNCPRALPLAVQALEAYQYLGNFAALDRYLDRLRQDDFTPSSETELVDCLEQLLFLLLYFDIEPEMQLGLYRAYDAAAPRVYGAPLPARTERRPGRLRIGYLSGDLRDHVMGKMMWAAVCHHDRDRFEIFFYSLSAVSDPWTERYRGLADGFHVLAELSEREAAQRIAADDLDVLVDLSTHTRGAKPGILALKPARVQITHIASAGAVGLRTIDFKLTDRYADLPESQAYQLETLLAMEGCVYPYHHVAPAADYPFHRDRLGIPADAVVMAAFANPLKLSRRCLALWREVLERIPRAMLAISPLSPQARAVYARLLTAAGIPLPRVIPLPQGRNDAENQARYHLVDFTLDPLPYGGVNGTLEALDMGVPVVTLAGRRHGERTSYSILANLGVTDTIAASGSEYVAIAQRLADDRDFAQRVRDAIGAGLASSPLTDMPAHTRHLEQAYVSALAQRDLAALAAAARR